MKQKPENLTLPNRHLIFLRLLVVCLSWVALAACTGRLANVSNAGTARQYPNATCGSPIVAAVVIDQTGSMKWSGTPQVTIDDLRTLFDRLTDCGGELGVAFVRSRSDLGIERIRLPEPPPPLYKPVKKDGEENYEFVDRVAAFHQQELGRDSVIDKQNEEMKPKIAAFLVSLKPLLDRPHAGGTDLNGGLNRAEIFLAERGDSWRSKPSKYLILISDAIDTEKKQRLSLSSGAAFFWVNATSAEKISPVADAVRFESFAAAVRQIGQVKRYER